MLVSFLDLHCKELLALLEFSQHFSANTEDQRKGLRLKFAVCIFQPKKVKTIAVGGGGAVAPPFGSKRRKFGQIVSLFGHTSGEKPSQFQ